MSESMKRPVVFGEPLDHTKNCSTEGCQKSALFYPVVKFWAKCDPKHLHPAIEVEVEVQFCSEHKEDFKAEDVYGISQEVWKACKLCGAADPDIASAAIEMRPLIVA